jgi:hypothetical protein
MFPRNLNLDAKAIDDFCMEKVDRGKNSARLYIESLHLKPFMKDKETLMDGLNPKRKDSQVQSNHTPKRPCLPLRRSSPEGKAKSTEQSTKHDKDEGIMDRNLLSQMYFGGFDGKRSCFLSNGGSEAGGGIAASYCQFLPQQPLNQWDHPATHAGVLTARKKKNGTNSSLSDDHFNHALLFEKKLAMLRNQMKLYNRLSILDNFVTSDTVGSPSKDDGDVKRLQSLIKPIGGYTPPSVDATESDTTIRRGNSALAASSCIENQEIAHTPENSSPSMSIESPKRELHQSEENYNKQADVSNIIEGDNTHGKTEYDSMYESVVQEGRAQSLAANLLLESFRRSRRTYLYNNNHFKCAWCSGSSSLCCSGDSLIQCLDCDLVGCGSSLSDNRSCGKQHIMLHFLLSGHRYGKLTRGSYEP